MPAGESPTAGRRWGELPLEESELRTAALGDGNWILLEPALGPLGESLRAERAPRAIVGGESLQAPFGAS